MNIYSLRLDYLDSIPARSLFDALKYIVCFLSYALAARLNMDFILLYIPLYVYIVRNKLVTNTITAILTIQFLSLIYITMHYYRAYAEHIFVYSIPKYSHLRPSTYASNFFEYVYVLPTLISQGQKEYEKYMPYYNIKLMICFLFFIVYIILFLRNNKQKKSL